MSPGAGAPQDAVPRVERMVTTGSGIRLWTECFGDRNDPTVLLSMGRSTQGIFWHDRFCEALAGRGFQVIRYDHRDTGRSTCVDFEARPYDLGDLAEDAVEVLAAAGCGAAHIVGVSMGGTIAALMALDHPRWVRSLTLVAASPDGRPYAAAMAGEDTSRYELPPPEPAFVELMRRLLSEPPTTTEAAVAACVELTRLAVGPKAPLDEPMWRELHERSMARAEHPEAAGNHGAAAARAGPVRPRLADIRHPTLVIHGGLDACLPLPHGQALAAGIPGARLWIEDDMGHMFPPEWSDRLITVIEPHLRAGR